MRGRFTGSKVVQSIDLWEHQAVSILVSHHVCSDYPLVPWFIGGSGYEIMISSNHRGSATVSASFLIHFRNPSATILSVSYLLHLFEIPDLFILSYLYAALQLTKSLLSFDPPLVWMCPSSFFQVIFS